MLPPVVSLAATPRAEATSRSPAEPEGLSTPWVRASLSAALFLPPLPATTEAGPVLPPVV